jgi:hypothetical protein
MRAKKRSQFPRMAAHSVSSMSRSIPKSLLNQPGEDPACLHVEKKSPFACFRLPGDGDCKSELGGLSPLSSLGSGWKDGVPTWKQKGSASKPSSSFSRLGGKGRGSASSSGEQMWHVPSQQGQSFPIWLPRLFFRWGPIRRPHRKWRGHDRMPVLASRNCSEISRASRSPSFAAYAPSVSVAPARAASAFCSMTRETSPATRSPWALFSFGRG